MTKRFARWMLGLAVAAAGVGVAAPLWTHGDVASAAQAVPAQQLATVDQMKAEAFKALKAGHFDKTSELLDQASKSANDPQLTQMAAWTKQFEDQRQVFVAERRKQFDKAVGDVKKLVDNKKEDYAVDYVARAHLLADDKKAFRNEKWVDDLVKRSVDAARKYEGAENWLKALRLYSDLSSVDPSTPEWKDKLKLATRRIRLLAMYNNEEFKKIQDVEATERDSVDQLIKPSTQPSTKSAATKPTPEERDDSFKTDWHQSLKDITNDMLWDALVKARERYYREVSYRDLGLGGLNGLKVIATTKGLEAAFPGLKDEKLRGEFVGELDKWLDRMKNATVDSEQAVLRRAIENVERVCDATVKLPTEVFVSEFADGAFAELDPFTSMIWPSETEEFNKNVQGEFVGVGIQIQSDEDGSLKVVTPLEDSPGYKAGIKPGDVITKINGKNAKGIALSQAVKNITGLPNTKVTLTIRSTDGTVKDYTIVREKIKVMTVKGWLHRPGGGWDYMIDPQNGIGYVRLTQFARPSTDEMERALADMRKSGMKAIILDLRYNPGGLLGTATEICDKFLNNGVIVSTRADRPTPDPAKEERAKPDDDDILNTPMVILVNQYSASASEIVSGAMKDHKRALIVGERTFGKGSVQMLFPMPARNAFLKLTTHHYYLPLGKCIHREENSTDWGVDPDVTVEMTPEQMRSAIDARQEMDILRGPNNDAAPDKPAKAPAGGDATAKAKKDPLTQDAQLSAAVLLLRLQLAGAHL